MSTAVGLLLVGGVVVVIVVLGRMTDFAAKKANQTLFQRKAHVRGQELVTRTLEFSAPGENEGLLEAVVTHVNAHGKAPVVVPGLYLAERTPDRVVFVYGSKVNSLFTADVALTDHPGDAISGILFVREWSLSDGIVAGIDEIERLYARVEAPYRASPANASLDQLPSRTCCRGRPRHRER